MTQPVGLLSGGQRQALTLLMATMNPPKLLLLDEHTAALDPGTAEKVLNLTKRIVEEHQLTCLMIMCLDFPAGGGFNRGEKSKCFPAGRSVRKLQGRGRRTT